MARPARELSLDEVLDKHRLRSSRDRLLRTLDRSLQECLSGHRFVPPTPRRSVLLARGGFRQADQESMRAVAAKAAADYAALVETALTTAEVAEFLGVSQSRVRQLTGQRRLAALPGKPRRYPQWQLVERGLLPNLDLVLPAADARLEPVSLWRFFVTADQDLIVGDEPVSPREWLMAGADPVRVAALLAAL